MSNYQYTIAACIRDYVRRRKGTLSLSIKGLAREIRDYIRIRETTSFCMVKRDRKPDPKGWTLHNEEVWRDWISNMFDIQSWMKEVIKQIYGSYHEDWHIEIFDYIIDWVERDFKIVTEYDKEPIEEKVEELYGGLDPYMVEHGLIKGITRDCMNPQHD